MNPVNLRDDLAAARLLDFFDARTSWHRSLWNPGLVIALKELPEASNALRAGVLAEKAVGFAIQSTVALATTDSGIENKAVRKALQESLRLPLRPGGLDYSALVQLTEQIEKTYLSCWATQLQMQPQLNPERIARAVASHLLDIGFHSDYLHRWWKYRLSYEMPRRSLHDLVAEAHGLASSPPRSFDVLVAFQRAPEKKYGRPDGWLDSGAVAAWLAANNFDTAGVKQIGGLQMRIPARDPQAAVEITMDAIDNLAARARIATTSELRWLQHVWIAGEKVPGTLIRRTPGLDLGALIRENVVYTRRTSEDAVDAAFEIIAPLQTGSPSAAIAAGWAAIEALLGEPDDRGGAADRLASIVACSFPRAELTRLSYVLQKDDQAMRGTLDGVSENNIRATRVAEAIVAKQELILNSWSDRAALQRMQNLLSRPTEALNDIRKYVAIAFRRLYRQRNLVLHGGKTNAVALGASLRTATPLIGAGLDRIAHGHYVEGISPIVVAARAHIALSTLENQPAKTCANLLASP